MEERTKKIIIWVVAIAVGLVVIFAVSGILDNIWYKYSQSQFSVEKEEFCYTMIDTIQAMPLSLTNALRLN